MKKTLLFIFLLLNFSAIAQIGSRWYSYTDYVHNKDLAAGGDDADTYLVLWNDTMAMECIGVYPFYNQFSSTGMSFAPRLSAWNHAALYGSSIKVGPTDAYIIDSIRIKGYYKRPVSKPLVKDTLKIGFVYGDGTSSSNMPALSITGPHYGTTPFLDMLYDSVNNLAKRASLSTPAVITQNIILSAADANDTDMYGIVTKYCTFSGPVTIPAGNFVSVSVTFKSGDATFMPFDTIYNPTTFTNPEYGLFMPLVQYKLDVPGGITDWAIYDAADSNSGFFQERRYSTGWGHDYTPHWAYSGGGGGPAYVQYPVIDFHVVCPTCNLIDTLSGANHVCVSGATILSYVTSGGSWSSSNPSVATISSTSGIVSGISAGTVTITYTLSGHVATTSFTVIAAPSAGVISGSSSVCVGSTITLTDGVAGGTWSSSGTGVATVGTTGIVSGVSFGTATISYTVTNSCGSVYATKIVSVGVVPVSGTVSGPGTVCAGSTITLTDTATGGTWSSVYPSIATVNTAGVVSGLSAGIDTIKYTVTNSCGTAVATKVITVNPLPNASSISGATTVCVGSTITLTDTATGGTWSSVYPSIATVNTAGVVSGVAAGIDTVNYTVTNSCGSATATKVITVNPLPNASSIAGPTTVCVGSIITLVDTATGGVWSATNSHAFVSSTGVVLGVSAGVDTIKYTVTNSCGMAVAYYEVTVNSIPDAGVLSGPDTVCIGTTITLSGSAAGGIWSATNTNALVSGTGTVAGLVIGIDTIKYTVTTPCGTATATKVIYVSGCNTGVENVPTLPTINVYPNPIDEYVIIESTEPIETVCIYNILGQKVIYETVNNNLVKISTVSLPKGMYVLKVNDKTIVKIVK